MASMLCASRPIKDGGSCRLGNAEEILDVSKPGSYFMSDPLPAHALIYSKRLHTHTRSDVLVGPFKANAEKGEGGLKELAWV